MGSPPLLRNPKRQKLNGDQRYGSSEEIPMALFQPMKKTASECRASNDAVLMMKNTYATSSRSDQAYKPGLSAPAPPQLKNSFVHHYYARGGHEGHMSSKNENQPINILTIIVATQIGCHVLNDHRPLQLRKEKNQTEIFLLTGTIWPVCRHLLVKETVVTSHSTEERERELL